MQRRTVRLAIPAGCLALAGASLLIPSTPTTDPWGWIVWGREITHLNLDTAVFGAPSWKPLPVLVTTPLALAGGAAPALWLVVARAAGLAGLFLGYRLGARVAGPWAGLLTVVGVVLGTSWLRAMAHGYSEPLAEGLVFAAVLAHLSARPKWAVAFGALVALTRPEAWCLVLLYGAVQWRRGEIRLPFLAAALAAVPALWVVPDWIGSGQFLHAEKTAHSVNPNGAAALVDALGWAATIVPLPLAIAALAGSLLALLRRDGVVLQLVAAVLVWTGLLAAMMLGGYPVSGRFFILPAALVCVLGGVGVVRLLDLVQSSTLRVAAAALLAILALPPTVARINNVEDEGHATVTRARFVSSLRVVVRRATPELRTCGDPAVPSGLGWTRGAIAWDLRLPLARVHDMHTSVREFVKRLSSPGDEPLPRLGQGQLVKVRSARPSFVLLAPFGSAEVRLSGHRRRRLTTVAAAGIWRADARRGAGCEIPDRRNLARAGPRSYGDLVSSSPAGW